MRALLLVLCCWRCALAASALIPQTTLVPTRLNNLVVEILQIHGERAKAIDSIKHFQPVDGWVYVSAKARLSGGERIFLGWDGNEDARQGLVLNARNEFGEKQTWLAAGEHQLGVDRAGRSDLDSLTIRRVPETSFSKFGATPRVLAGGDHDWDWLSQHLLPHVNTVVGYNNVTQISYLRQWKSRGGRWLVDTSRFPAPADLLRDYSAVSALVDGVNIDEFGPGLRSLPAWTAEFPNLTRSRQFEGKQIRAYIAQRPEDMPEFINSVMSAGGSLVWERYLGEIPPEYDEEPRLRRDLGDWMRAITNHFPGIVARSVVCLGMFSAPPLSLNRSPEIDYKVWLDKQFQQVATDPVFRGLPGLMVYQTRTADEETARWAGALFRHYAIEGETNLLSERYGFGYHLAHLRNGDFAKGLEGWNVRPPLAPLSAKRIERLAQWQGRYHYHEHFDTTAVAEGSEEPITVSQPLRNLQPGRAYSVKLISVKVADLQSGRSEPEMHPVRLSALGGDILRERTFQQTIAASGRRTEPFTVENPLWVNYHQVVFLAGLGGEVEITVLPRAEAFAVNFVEVQPYFAE